MTASSECGRGARLRRSCLAVPGSSEKMLAKAATLPADMVFVDLEDAVAPQEKTDATRARVVEALRRGLGGAHPGGARERGLHALVLPRHHRSRGGRGTCSRLHRGAEGRERGPRAFRRQLALPARVGARARAPDRARAADREPAGPPGDRGDRGRERAQRDPDLRARRLCRVPRCAAALRRRERPALSRRPVALRADADRHHGPGVRPPGDRRPVRGDRRRGGIHARSARRSHLLGFDGKWALHPDQIVPCNEVYTPSAAEYERAERVLQAYAARAREPGSVR